MYRYCNVGCYVQVLSQVTPNPNDVKREVAQCFPKKNRSEDFLPRESQRYNQFYHCFYLLFSAADKHRVILKGELSDYIHATYVNVSLFCDKMKLFFCCVRATSTRRHL